MRGCWSTVVTLSILLLGLGSLSCGESTKPRFDHEIRVERLRFFPNDISIGPGSRVRFVNVERKGSDTIRTVTSGAGPMDPERGNLFDEVLEGFDAGNVDGDDFLYDFDERGTFTYYTRFPEGEEFTGTIRVQ